MGEYSINFSITFITKQDGTHGSYERDYLVAESSGSWVDYLGLDVVEAATFLLNRLIKKRTPIGVRERKDIIANIEPMSMSVTKPGTDDLEYFDEDGPLSQIFAYFISYNLDERKMSINVVFIK